MAQAGCNGRSYFDGIGATNNRLASTTAKQCVLHD